MPELRLALTLAQRLGMTLDEVMGMSGYEVALWIEHLFPKEPEVEADVEAVFR